MLPVLPAVPVCIANHCIEDDHVLSIDQPDWITILPRGIACIHL